MVIEFRILGPLEVRIDGRVVRLGGPRQRATLALLLLQANRVVPVERLADELYAGRPPVTAVTQVQRQVSDLRKLLREDSIETRARGYLLHVAEDAFDLARFERLTERAAHAHDADEASELFAEALALWRGPALADLEYEDFAAAAVRRLEELRLAALEERLALDVDLGRHARAAAELAELVAEHPLRERLRALQMVALDRAGRPAEALEAYREAHRALSQSVGLEPSPELRRLEHSLRSREPAVSEKTNRTVVAVTTGAELGALVSVAAALRGADIVLVRLVDDEAEVGDAARTLRANVPERARTAVFTSGDPTTDVIRLATANDAELVLVCDPEPVDLYARSPATVASVAGPAADLTRGVAVPFGGGEHDWAALELAAQLAGSRITLIGTRANDRRRDASRLLADASLALQRVAAVDVVPLLAEDVVAAAGDAGLVIAGVSPRWRVEGVGAARRALVASGVPTVLVHRGPRPSALAPRDARTRFTWTLESA